MDARSIAATAANQGYLTSAEHIDVEFKKPKYFFDSTIEINGDTVTLNGSVKWGFTDDEILAFIKHLKSVVPIKSAEINYEETGCLLYGCF